MCGSTSHECHGGRPPAIAPFLLCARFVSFKYTQGVSDADLPYIVAHAGLLESGKSVDARKPAVAVLRLLEKAVGAEKVLEAARGGPLSEAQVLRVSRVLAATQEPRSASATGGAGVARKMSLKERILLEQRKKKDAEAAAGASAEADRARDNIEVGVAFCHISPAPNAAESSSPR